MIPYFTITREKLVIVFQIEPSIFLFSKYGKQLYQIKVQACMHRIAIMSQDTHLEGETLSCKSREVKTKFLSLYLTRIAQENQG